MNEIQKLAIALSEKTTAQKIMDVLPANGSTGDVKQFVRLCCNAISVNPHLLKCDRSSLFMAIINAAATGLSPDPQIGQIYFVPYKNRVQCRIGYKGFVALAYRSEKVLSFAAEVVRVGDDFDFQLGTGSFVKHIIRSPLSAPITHAYAIATLSGGVGNPPIKEPKVMRTEEIEATRKRSPAAASSFSPWHTDYPAMAMKTVIRRLAVLLPVPEMQKAMAIEEQTEIAFAETAEESIVQQLVQKEPGENKEPRTDGGIEMALDGMGGEGEADAPIQKATASSISPPPINKKYEIKKIETNIRAVSDRGAWHVLYDTTTQYHTMDATVKKFAEDAIKNKWRVIISYEDRRDKKVIELIERG